MRILSFLTAFVLMIAPVHALEQDAQKIQKIEDYLNNVKTLKASFVQTASNGSTSEGTLLVAKPNKIRMEYKEPANILIVGDGKNIVYNDKDLDQVTNINYDDVPASLILADNIKIDGEQIKVSNYFEDKGSTVVTLRYPSKPEIAPITLTFTTEPFALRQWSIVDPQGIEVLVSLYDVETDTSFEDGTFKFKKAKSPLKYKGKKIYFVGITNSGKSTLINALIKSYNGVDGEITMSNYPSTTLGVVDESIGEIHIKDTPGIVIENSIVNYMDSNGIKKVNSKKEIKPVTIQIHDNGAILIDELFRIEYQTDNSSMTFYFSNNLDIQNISFKNPRLLDCGKKEITIPDNSDLVIEDIGFIKFTKKAKIILYEINDVYMYVRDKLI